MSKDKCCNNAIIRKAFVPCKPFKAEYCLNCRELTPKMDPLLKFIWKYFVGPFWDGRIQLLLEEEDDNKYINDSQRT